MEETKKLKDLLLENLAKKDDEKAKEKIANDVEDAKMAMSLEKHEAVKAVRQAQQYYDATYSNVKSTAAQIISAKDDLEATKAYLTALTALESSRF